MSTKRIAGAADPAPARAMQQFSGREIGGGGFTRKNARLSKCVSVSDRLKQTGVSPAAVYFTAKICPSSQATIYCLSVGVTCETKCA